MRTSEVTCEARNMLLLAALLAALPVCSSTAVAAQLLASTPLSLEASWSEDGGESAQDGRDEEDAQTERQTDLYDDGREALDEQEYERALEVFSKLSAMEGAPVDAALYWKAYAENRLGRLDSALASLSKLQQLFPQSRWSKDAGALELEVRQASGATPRPEAQADEELKLLALHGLMRSDPERALPMLEKVLNGTNTAQVKSQALFVLAQSGSAQSREILGRIAKGQSKDKGQDKSNPELQRKSVQYLGMFGGAQAKQTLAEVYAASGDLAVKRMVLHSFMISGAKDRLFAVAKSESDEGLKREAVRQLGLMRAQSELQQLYKTEKSGAVRRELLQAFFLAGDAGRLAEAAQNETDPQLRRAAVRNLGLIRSAESSGALQAIYARETDRAVRAEVLNAYFLQGNAGAIVAIARTEKDPELKKLAVSKLSVMGSKEGADYLLELLEK